MTNRQIDNKKTRQIRIDAELHYLIKIQAANEKVSIKLLVEEVLGELVGYLPPEVINKKIKSADQA